MSKSYWYRVAIMVLTLVGVVWAMQSLRHKGPPSAWNAILPPPSDRFSLCPARVAWLESPSSNPVVRLEEQGNHWWHINSAARLELDPIAVEKWFSQFCSALAVEFKPGANRSPPADLKPTLRLGYVTGQTQTLMRSPTSGEFQLSGHTFTSKDLDHALANLHQLPPASPPGQP